MKVNGGEDGVRQRRIKQTEKDKGGRKNKVSKLRISVSDQCWYLVPSPLLLTWVINFLCSYWAVKTQAEHKWHLTCLPFCCWLSSFSPMTRLQFVFDYSEIYVFLTTCRQIIKISSVAMETKGHLIIRLPGNSHPFTWLGLCMKSQSQSQRT